MIGTRLTQRFGIRHPVLCAPMAYVTGGALAAAVSRPGGTRNCRRGLCGHGGWRWWNPVLAEPLPIEHGMATVDGVVGTGVAWNERAVERFLA
jgi:L-alanine-DL-glutamate epimerase-like enolase superfamily enzyme